MEGKFDNIYIYLWEELNAVYIGRTINPKSRHYQHRHTVTDTTYKFCSEHHVEHPKMIIIENGLTIEEGVEREKYWINEYRENSKYNVLNKKCGGQTGKHVAQTKEKIEERKKKLKEYKKKYYEINKEKIKLDSKKYREENKEKIKKYREENKEKIKKYYEKNASHIRLTQKTYKNEHKNEIKEYRKKYYEMNKK